MYSIKNVVERLGNAEHEYGAVRFLMSSICDLLNANHSGYMRVGIIVLKTEIFELETK
jgi:hypothetical protein